MINNIEASAATLLRGCRLRNEFSNVAIAAVIAAGVYYLYDTFFYKAPKTPVLRQAPELETDAKKPVGNENNGHSGGADAVDSVSEPEWKFVLEQQGSSCGFHAVYNAEVGLACCGDFSPQAIQLLNDKTAFKRRFHDTYNEFPSLGDDLRNLLGEQDRESIFVVENFDEVGFNPEGSQSIVGMFGKCSQQNCVVSFVVNTWAVNPEEQGGDERKCFTCENSTDDSPAGDSSGPHWVAVTVQKVGGRVVKVLYMDSMNKPIRTYLTDKILEWCN